MSPELASIAAAASQESSWLEEIWADREERLYPAMFGPMRGIFPIPPARFERFDAPADPRWLTIGVFECAPTATRSSWLYVTSGLSNPWGDEADPNEPTGYGCEFAIETARQGDWAIRQTIRDEPRASRGRDVAPLWGM